MGVQNNVMISFWISLGTFSKSRLCIDAVFTWGRIVFTSSRLIWTLVSSSCQIFVHWERVWTQDKTLPLSFSLPLSLSLSLSLFCPLPDCLIQNEFGEVYWALRGDDPRFETSTGRSRKTTHQRERQCRQSPKEDHLPFPWGTARPNKGSLTLFFIFFFLERPWDVNFSFINMAIVRSWIWQLLDNVNCCKWPWNDILILW